MAFVKFILHIDIFGRMCYDLSKEAGSHGDSYLKMGKREEKRRSPRVKVYTPLRYQIRGESRPENILTDNLSAHGIAFTSDKFIAPKTVVMLEFNVLSRTLRPIGKVVWSHTLSHSDRFRSGIEFLEIEPGERNYILDYLNMHL